MLASVRKLEVDKVNNVRKPKVGDYEGTIVYVTLKRGEREEGLVKVEEVLVPCYIVVLVMNHLLKMYS